MSSEDDDANDKVEKTSGRRVVPDERVVHVLDVLLRASNASQTRQLRRKAPLFDLLVRVRAACGGYGPLHKWLALLAGERTRDSELLTVGLAVRLLRTTDLSVEQVAQAVAHLVDREPLYATCCTVIALIRLEYMAQLMAFLASPAGEEFKRESGGPVARGVLFAQTQRQFAAAAVLVAIESGAFASAEFLLRQPWFGERISLCDLEPIGAALDRLVHQIMAHAETDPRAVPLFQSDEAAVKALRELEFGYNLHRVLHQLQQWQRQSTRPLDAAERALVQENQHAYQLSRLVKLSQTAGLVHVSVAQELSADAERDMAPIGTTLASTQAQLAKQLRDKLEERTRVCAQLEEMPPADIDQAKVADERPLVLAALEDAIYRYRIMLAAVCSGHERALAASRSDRLAEQARATEQAFAAICTQLDAD